MRKYSEYKEHYPDKTDAQIIDLLGWELGEKVQEIGKLLVEVNGYKALYLEGRELLGDCLSINSVYEKDNYLLEEIKAFLTNHKDGE